MSAETKSTDADKPKRYRPQPTQAPVDSKLRLIGVPELLNLTGWSIDTLTRRLAAGEFPQPVEGNKGMKRRWTLRQYETWAARKEDAADKVA